MTEAVKKFIEEHIALIETSRWDDIYKEAEKILTWRNTGEFTEVILNAGLHPEAYMDNIPANFLRDSNITSFNIPDNIESIGYNAFENCRKLVNVNISRNLNCIYAEAFSKCYLLSHIDLPDTIKTIGPYAFNGCKSFTSIIIPNNIKYIYEGVFRGCENITSLVIPDSVSRLGGAAFIDCRGLKTVELPRFIEFDEKVFDDCGYIDITYNGSREEWKHRYYPLAFDNTTFIAHCTDGDVAKEDL